MPEAPTAHLDCCNQIVRVVAEPLEDERRERLVLIDDHGGRFPFDSSPRWRYDAVAIHSIKQSHNKFGTFDPRAYCSRHYDDELASGSRKTAEDQIRVLKVERTEP